MANTVKHTPGPWDWEMTRSGSNFSGLVSHYQDGYRDVITSDEYAGAAWMEISDADARLIAASPDLLDAAVKAAGVMERNIYPKPDVGPDHPYSIFLALKAAIAKAEGRAQ